MTPLFIIGLLIIVLLYGLGFLGIAVQLRNAPHPFPPRWAKRHFLLTDNLRRSLWIVLVLLVVNAFVFLVPAFTSANHRDDCLWDCILWPLSLVKTPSRRDCEQYKG